MPTAGLIARSQEDTFEHFCVHGWMRVRAAFSVDEAAAMRTAAWRALATVGIRRSDPSTWSKERPERLQHVKDDPAFRAVGSVRLLKAIDAALEGHAYEKPEHWGALFLATARSTRRRLSSAASRSSLYPWPTHRRRY